MRLFRRGPRSGRGRVLVAMSVGLVGGLLPAVPFVPGGASRVDALSSPVDTMVRYENTFYAFTNPGEHLDIAFTKYVDASDTVDDGAAEIVVRGPGDQQLTCGFMGTEAAGASCPFAGLSAAVAGVWEIHFQAPTGAGVGTPSADYYTWDIDVEDASDTEQPGRVWVEQYVMAHDPALPTTGTSFTLWYQSQHGYQYSADYENYNGHDSVFSSNATGVAHASGSGCVSAYESIDIGGPHADTDFYLPTTECGDRYKIFFAEPDPSLPASVELPGGASTWLLPPVVVPTLTDFAFEQAPGDVRIGTFTFESVDFTGNAQIQIDVDGNGSYVDPVDRSIPIAIIGDGAQAVDFDGLDGLGQPIPTSAALRARVRITRVGEIHFALEDAEMRGALRVTAHTGPQVGPSTVYWNDTELLVTDRDCPTSVLDGTAGFDSSAGVHGWDCVNNANDGVHGSWGDLRVIDDWTYQSIDQAAVLFVPPVPVVPPTTVPTTDPTTTSTTSTTPVPTDPVPTDPQPTTTPTGSSGSELPRTGGDFGVLVVVGLTSVVLGALAVLLARRRRSLARHQP